MAETLSPSTATPRGSFHRRFIPLFLLGLLGVATLPLILTPLIRAAPVPPGAPKLPLPLLMALSLIQPTLLLASGVAVGAVLAPRLGLVSRVAAWAEHREPLGRGLRADVPLAVGLGVALAVVTVLLDATVFQPHLEAVSRMVKTAQQRTIATTLLGVFYGGITEELVMRWGLVSLVAWLGWRVLQAGRGRPHAGVMWTAIALAALLFAAGHLPAAAALVPLTPLAVIRIIGLNALGGLLFGWLFWRRSLEAAMMAHAAVHVGISIAAWTMLPDAPA